jgi:hypothetical protein
VAATRRRQISELKEMVAMKKALLAAGVVAMVLVGLPGPAWAETTGPQRLTVVIRQELGQPQPTFSKVIASGVINAVGTDVFEDSPEGDPASYSQYVFPEGMLSVTTMPEAMEFTQNPRSCVGRLNASGTWTITGGSGAYEGARGHGTLTVKGTIRSEREAQGCSDVEGTLNGIIRATGDITLPSPPAA